MVVSETGSVAIAVASQPPLGDLEQLIPGHRELRKSHLHKWL